jgi:uncharacterized membrane protein
MIEQLHTFISTNQLLIEIMLVLIIFCAPLLLIWLFTTILSSLLKFVIRKYGYVLTTIVSIVIAATVVVAFFASITDDVDPILLTLPIILVMPIVLGVRLYFENKN